MALAHHLEGEMDGALAIVALSARGFAAMLEIAREEVTSQESLARRLGRGRSATSELLMRLRRQGLVAPAPSNARRRNAATTGGRPPTPVALTPAGQAVLEKAARIGMKLEHVWALRLSADHPEWPFPTARAVGLRRQLKESAAALRKRERGR
jgi:DNA-binding MarR family transcriptional regulator